MQRRWAQPIFLISLFLAALGLVWYPPIQTGQAAAQIPTVDIATVTSTPGGPYVVVSNANEPQANLRAGPNALFDRVGVLLAGQRAPAKGRSPGGDWILVEYAGAPGGIAWVYSALVRVEPPNTVLPIVEPPPTPTPVTTATLDPTLAARFVVTIEPTRLPTYTPPPPLAIPTFTAEGGPNLSSLPMGFVILGLAALGVFLGIVAFSSGR